MATKALLVILAVTSSMAKDIPIDWFIPAEDFLPPRTAEVGDTAMFNWSGFHNVFIHPTEDCTENGAIPVGTSTGAQYTFTEDDVGEVVFACDVGGHCELGMILTFTVPAPETPLPTPSPTPLPTSPPTPLPTPPPTPSPTPPPPTPSPTLRTLAPTPWPTPPVTPQPTPWPTSYSNSPGLSNPKTIPIDWFIPAEDFLPPRTAVVGDTAVFNWSGFHNVFIHPTGDCTEDDAVLVGTSSGVQYTFREDDVGEVFFACDVASHCELGMIIAFTVSNASGTPSPTPPPTPLSTATPSGTPSLESGAWSNKANGGMVLLLSTVFLLVI